MEKLKIQLNTMLLKEERRKKSLGITSFEEKNLSSSLSSINDNDAIIEKENIENSIDKIPDSNSDQIDVSMSYC